MPEIPQNTGAIGRICVCLGANLHLIKPLGFILDDSHLKRAGLDYWKYLRCVVHEDWEIFLKEESPNRMMFASTKGTKIYYDFKFSSGDYLIFGNETGGFPKSFYSRYREMLYTIPMPGEHSRSHNLASSVAIMASEAHRQFDA